MPTGVYRNICNLPSALYTIYIGRYLHNMWYRYIIIAADDRSREWYYRYVTFAQYIPSRRRAICRCTRTNGEAYIYYTYTV